MISQENQDAQARPQVLFVGVKDSKRLLEVYVKRSLSLNDGSQNLSRVHRRTRKWITPAERDSRQRKHSSDISLHLKLSSSEEDLGEDEAFSDPETERKEGTENRAKQWKRLRSLRGKNGSSASSSPVPVGKDDGRQPSLPATLSASDEDLSKNKALLEPRTETETSDQCKRRKKSSLSRKDGSFASQGLDGKAKNFSSPDNKDKQDAFKPDLVDSALPDQHHLESLTEVKKTKEGKKMKKSSIWKSVFGWFSRGSTDKQDEQDDDGRHEETCSTPEPAMAPLSCLPISTGDGIMLRHTKSHKKRRSQRKLSLKKSSRDMGCDKTTARPVTLALSAEAHNSQIQSIEEVEPNISYYEKMSEELEKIVNEMKNSPTDENKTFTDSVRPTDTEFSSKSQEEIIKRIIDLIKQEGDVINEKLKENASISSYFNTITYGSFQQLADQYVNSEVPQETTQPPVVKFAFTLDFTARVAALSRYAPGLILGFGKQYLKDRFSYISESHPHMRDITTETLEESSDKDERFEDQAEGQ